MKIMVIDHRPKRVPDNLVGWHLIPFILRDKGNKIEVVAKNEWWKFYFKYLRFRPDVVVSSGIIGFLPALFGKLRLMRAPHYHAWDDHYVEVMGKKWGVSFVAFAEYFIVKNADWISTPSKFLWNQAQMI